MNREYKIQCNKTYATADNARAAVAKKGFEDQRHFILPVETDKGLRYAPVFFGQDAMQQGIHFHFNCIG